MNARFFFPFIVAFCLAGCATPQVNTASGRPEVMVHGETIAQVRNVVVNHFVDRGFAPVSTEGSQLIFEHEGSFGESFAMGLLTNEPQSKVRITVTLVESESGAVRIVGGAALLGQSTFGRTQSVELSGKGYQQLQKELEAIKNRAEGG